MEKEESVKRDLIIQSEEDGAPAPWANTTRGDDFDFDFDGDSMSTVWSCRLRFEGGEEAIPWMISLISAQFEQIILSEIFVWPSSQMYGKPYVTRRKLVLKLPRR